MIPNEIIDQVLDKSDIVEVIAGYVPLKKAGQNFKALCPFHKEKTPSFMVSPSKQIFHCFGCGAGGNVISFLMKHENMDFIDALKVLAEKGGVALPRPAAVLPEKPSLAGKLYSVNESACKFYEENLKKEYGRSARQYLIQRGLSERTIAHFRLGFAQDTWQGLIFHCKTKEIDLELLERAGLILQNPQTGNWYDRFRNRIIFPIFDLRNNILGFGARALDDSLPKYINSPETYIYTKGRHPYGLNFSKEPIRKQNYVIIVEGYFDLILPFQNEIRNIVATLGTALTTEQINTFKRLTKNVIMVYDADKAGQEATMRGLELLIEEEMNVRIAVLPKGSDPDSFVRKDGNAGFMKILKESKDLFDYKLGVLTGMFKKNEPRGKARIVEEMLPTLAKIKNAVLKSGYLKKMAEELSLDEESVRSELKKIRPAFSRTYAVGVESKEASFENLAEITLLAMALENADCIKKIEEKLGVSKFRNGTIASILEKIEHFCKSGRKIIPSHLISYFEDDKIEKVISEAVSIGQAIQDKNKVFDDCIKHIKKDNLKETLSSIRLKIKEAENESDIDKINKLIAEYNELVKKTV